MHCLKLLSVTALLLLSSSCKHSLTIVGAGDSVELLFDVF